MQPPDPYRSNQPVRESNARTDRITVDAARFWAGGVAVAIVAAGVAVVGLMIARSIFNTTVLIQDTNGALVNANTWRYAAAAAVAALVAAALMHLLLLFAPSPRTFFVWIVGLATAAAVVTPFTTDATRESKFAVAAINLAIGLAVMTTILSISRTTTSTAPRA
jgi:Family of unknown function (DUF6069)